jgi:hypothetical protein
MNMRNLVSINIIGSLIWASTPYMVCIPLPHSPHTSQDWRYRQSSWWRARCYTEQSRLLMRKNTMQPTFEYQAKFLKQPEFFIWKGSRSAILFKAVSNL